MSPATGVRMEMGICNMMENHNDSPGAIDVILGPGEQRVLRLPEQTGWEGKLETVAVIWTARVAKDQNAHSRFEVH
jgi:hypothetical protein